MVDEYWRFCEVWEEEEVFGVRVTSLLAGVRRVGTDAFEEDITSLAYVGSGSDMWKLQDLLADRGNMLLYKEGRIRRYEDRLASAIRNVVVYYADGRKEKGSVGLVDGDGVWFVRIGRGDDSLYLKLRDLSHSFDWPFVDTSKLIGFSGSTVVGGFSGVLRVREWEFDMDHFDYSVGRGVVDAIWRSLNDSVPEDFCKVVSDGDTSETYACRIGDNKWVYFDLGRNVT